MRGPTRPSQELPQDPLPATDRDVPATGESGLKSVCGKPGGDAVHTLPGWRSDCQLPGNSGEAGAQWGHPHTHRDVQGKTGRCVQEGVTTDSSMGCPTGKGGTCTALGSQHRLQNPAGPKFKSRLRHRQRCP